MKTQEFINKVFALDIVPEDCYFEITRKDLVLYEPTCCTVCDDGMRLFINTKQRNSSSVYTDKFHASEEELKELCDLVKQYARTPIKAR